MYGRKKFLAFVSYLDVWKGNLKEIQGKKLRIRKELKILYNT